MSQPLFFAFDTEADGPCSGLYSMVSLGIAGISVPEQSFYRTFQPVSDRWVPESLAVSGFTREQAMAFPSAEESTWALVEWADALRADGSSLVLVSDNPAFDWQWVNYYCHRFAGRNPFGHSARRLGDLYAGWAGNPRDTRGWARWRKTKHTHNALDDARGVAEGWLGLTRQMREQKRPRGPG